MWTKCETFDMGGDLGDPLARGEAVGMAMARPRKGEEKGATTQIGVRVSPELRAKLDALARRHRRSITDEVRAALEAYAEAAGSRSAALRRPARKTAG